MRDHSITNGYKLMKLIVQRTKSLFLSPAVLALVCIVGVNSTALAAGEFIPKLTPGPVTFPAGINANGDVEGFILPGNQGFKLIGSTQFSNTRLRVFGRSQTTTSSDGTNNFFESRLGASAIDNKAYSLPFMQCQGLSAFYRLSVKELGPDGRGSVELDFRFDTPVRNLHLVVFDIDELSGSVRESLIVNAYKANSPSIANKVNAIHWKVLAQGDLSLYNSARPDQITLPPLWFAINADTPNSFGLLQARSRLRHESISNQNRDFTVLTNAEAIQQLRVNFRGPKAETRGANPSIGAHTYIGLWHPDQPCGYF
jgi:hypothetical protein